MSLILPKNKKWQQINGQIKIEIENSIFHECSKDWIFFHIHFLSIHS
jgi:hypothetical protein